jgi:hypothetical protein
MIGNKDYNYWYNYLEQESVLRARGVNRLGCKRLSGVLLVFIDLWREDEVGLDKPEEDYSLCC